MNMERVTATWLHDGGALLRVNEQVLIMNPSQGSGSNGRLGRDYHSLEISVPLRESDDIALNLQYYNEQGFHSAHGNLLRLRRKVTFCTVLQGM